MSRSTFLSPRFHYTFGPHEPVLRVAPGQSLRVICPDSDNMLGDGTLLTREQRQFSSGLALFEGNPLAGPIFVDGAEPGDCISVRIDGITLDRTFGQTGLAPGHGLLPAHLLAPGDGVVPKHLYKWEIDATRGVARLTNALGKDEITVPLRPFVGCIGTCPPHGQHISTLYAGDFGGNMDIPAMGSGATILLPVSHSGGLLLLGDLHAAQGHGEIIGGAIETSGVVDCTIDLIKGRRIAGPRVRDQNSLLAAASHGDVRTAIQLAYARLIDWLAEAGMNRFDAYNLASQAGSIIMGNLVTSPYSVAASIPIEALPTRVRQEGSR